MSVTPYDVDLKRNLDRETFREYQQDKIDEMYRRFPKGEFFVNWIFPKFYWDNGHDRYLFSGEGGHHPVAGGAIEMYGNETKMDWLDLLRMQIDMRDNHFRAVCWAKRVDNGTNAGMTGDFLFFTYCTHLLVYEQDAPQYWGTKWRDDRAGGQSPFLPPDFVYWDLGQPQQKFSSAAQAEVPNAPGLYARRFEKGTVFVNPSFKQALHYKLNAPLWDVQSRKIVSEVELAPRTGRLLLNITQ